MSYGEWDLCGWVQGVGLIGMVNVRPIVYVQPTRGAYARQARLIGELL